MSDLFNSYEGRLFVFIAGIFLIWICLMVLIIREPTTEAGIIRQELRSSRRTIGVRKRAIRRTERLLKTVKSDIIRKSLEDSIKWDRAILKDHLQRVSQLERALADLKNVK